MLKSLNTYLHEYSYLIFLIALTVWIGLSPMLETFINSEVLDLVIVSVIYISAFYFLYNSGKKMIAFTLVPLSIIVLFLSILLPHSIVIDNLNRFASLLLFLLITLHMITTILKSKKVDEHVIYASISGYVLLGLMAAVVSKILHGIIPNAYNMEASERVLDYVYYSLVTMSTLGYGDITPQVDASKSLAIFITLIGQFYMTVLVAFLVGKFISQKE